MFQKSQLIAASFGSRFQPSWVFQDQHHDQQKTGQHVDDVCWFLSVVETLKLCGFLLKHT